MALACSRCRRRFCGWCCHPAENEDECHRHVAHCSWKPRAVLDSGDPFHASMEEWREGSAAFKRARVAQFLGALPADLREEVVRRAG